MIRSKNLIKRFNDFAAVNGLDLEVKKGECFGLLGPNGAGKSTFIGMLYGASLRTEGELAVFGLDPSLQSRAIKARLGVVTQENALDESLTVEENMMIYAAFMGIAKELRLPRVEKLLTEMDLIHKRSAKIQTLSGGMKRRLVFVRALLSEPELVILDEPTTGLDPAVRHLLWEKVKALRASGVTIVLTTHYMHEAEILCDRVAILNRGELLTIGSPRSLIEEHSPGYVAVLPTGESLRVPTLKEVVDAEAKLSVRASQIRPANLEDVFLKLTGKELANDD
jgi:lipooligosaccharide transport system ATP-binding protein